jgi:hypothetical protein
MPYAALMVHGGAGQIEGSAVDAEGNNGERKQMVDRLAYTGKKFRASSAQLRNVEWRGIPDDTNNLVAREARAADLVIIGRKQDPRDLYYSLDPGITILRAGRPVLFVPNKTDSLEGPSHRGGLEGHSGGPPCCSRCASVPEGGEGNDDCDSLRARAMSRRCTSFSKKARSEASCQSTCSIALRAVPTEGCVRPGVSVPSTCVGGSACS